MSYFLMLSRILNTNLTSLLSSDESSGDEDDRVVIFPITGGGDEDDTRQSGNEMEVDQQLESCDADATTSNGGNALVSQQPPQGNVEEVVICLFGYIFRVNGLRLADSSPEMISFETVEGLNGTKISGGRYTFLVNGVKQEGMWMTVTEDPNSELESPKGYCTRLIQGKFTIEPPPRT